MKKRLNIICLIMAPLVIIILSAYFKIPNKVVSVFDKPVKSSYSSQPITAKEAKDNIFSSSYRIEKSKNTKLSSSKPIEEQATFVRDNSEISVYPGGQPIGVKLNTKGVLVVALSDIEGTKGKIPSPAANAGVQIGDSIVKINDVEINHAEDVTRLISEKKGSEITLKLQRKNNRSFFEIKVSPTLDSTDGKQKIGLWVRDSTAGVGTLTFYHDKEFLFS